MSDERREWMELVAKLRAQLAAAEARANDLAWRYNSDLALRDMELDRLQAQLAASEARVRQLEARPVKDMDQIVREYFDNGERAKMEVGNE